MASKQDTSNKSEGSWTTFLKDNKYAIVGVAAVGALTYYALKAKTNTGAPTWVPEDHDRSNQNAYITKVEQIDYNTISKEAKPSCDECQCQAKPNAVECKDSNIDFATPMDAFKNGKRETLLYTTATRTGNDTESSGVDFVAVVDVDPTSKTYCTVISQVSLGKDQEVHHSGWNACASCYGMAGFNRKYLVVPAFGSGDIHFIDVSDPKKPKKHRTVSGKMIKEKYGLSYPHTSHCLPNGNVMVSYLGVDAEHKQNQKNNGADFLWINEKFEVEQRWVKNEAQRPKYGYDYWYQPYHNIMISTEWGTPKAFSQGFNPQHIDKDMYGSSIHFWNWNEHTLIKTKTFDINKVCMPLEVRFWHDPKSVHAIVGAALTSNVIHIYKNDKKEWITNADYIQVEGVEMSNWALPTMPGLITDVLMSMDDKYVYFSNWLHGDIRQYDVSDPFKPRLNSRCYVGGLLREDSGYNVKDKSKNKAPIVPKVKGRRIEGGPQMLQLSLDGKRLYVTNSLFSAYDKQFYPDLVTNGGQMLLIDIDLDNNAEMTLNRDFIVDFGECEGGAARPHEMRYPGGDCSSDIFLVQ